MNKLIDIVIVSILFFTSAIGQSTIDLSKNKNDKNINIKGTYLSIDTSGLNLKVSASPRVFINENDHTVFSIEQKQVSVENYESFIEKMLKFDSVFTEKKVIFNEFRGKMIVGKINIENTDKAFWICYLGNNDFIIEIKGFYNLNLESKYKAAFEKAIKSIFINSKREISIYEDLPFYLDEHKFPYKKELSFMPQSIALSRNVDGNNRTLTIAYLKSNKDGINELKKEFINNVEKKLIGKKEVITKLVKKDNRIKLEGIIIKGNQVISLNCISSDLDKKAIIEFKEIAKSIKFK